MPGAEPPAQRREGPRPHDRERCGPADPVGEPELLGAVEVEQGSSGLPAIRVSRENGKVIVDGGLSRRNGLMNGGMSMRNCNAGSNTERPGEGAGEGAGACPVEGRRLVLGNNDVRITYVVTGTEASPLYRNAIGDECVYVQEGAGTVETVFGVLPYRTGDYVLVPRATDHRSRLR